MKLVPPSSSLEDSVCPLGLGPLDLRPFLTFSEFLSAKTILQPFFNLLCTGLLHYQRFSVRKTNETCNASDYTVLRRVWLALRVTVAKVKWLLIESDPIGQRFTK